VKAAAKYVDVPVSIFYLILKTIYNSSKKVFMVHHGFISNL